MTEHAREMHEHSLIAHEEERDGGKFSRREKEILIALGDQALTDREILTRTAHQDMNAIRPRVTELIKRGTLAEIGSKTDQKTGKRVRIVARRPAGA